MSANDRQVGGDHYKAMGVEVWDVVDTWPKEQQIGYYRGNALKYIMRLGSKDADTQEALKAQHYLEKLGEVLGRKVDTFADSFVPIPVHDEPAADGWIKWDGGKCPVPGDTAVAVQFCGGDISAQELPAGRWDWTHRDGGDCNIIGYRVLK